MSSSVIAGVNVEDISPHLNCFICNRLIRSPKLLPCLHSFCEVCLLDAVRGSDDGKISCPVCTTNVQFTKDGVSGLPSNSFLDNMLDIALINASDSQPVPCSSCDSSSPANSRCVDCGEFLCESCFSVHMRIRQTKEHKVLKIDELLASKKDDVLHRPAFCGIHHTEQLRYFCETCNEAVCRDCLIIEHRLHKYDYIRDSKKVQRQRVAMEKLLEGVQKNLPNLENSIQEIRGITDTLEGRLNTVRTEIRQMTLNHIRLIKEKERKLLHEAEKAYNYKAKTLNRQLETLELEHVKFTAGCGFSQQVLRYANGVELLSLKEHITKRLQELGSAEIDCRPLENGDLNYVVELSTAEKAIMEAMGGIRTSGKLITGDLEDPTFEKAVQSYVTDEDEPIQRDAPISVDLKDGEGYFVSPDTKLQGGQSYAAFTPYLNGTYTMTVVVRGEILEGFPLDINIGDIRPRSRSAKKTFSGNGSKFGKLGDPHGVTVDKEGNVIVTDSRNHRIQVFTKDGKFMHRFGSLGTRDGQFQFPSGVAVTPHGDVVVADTMNNRVQVLRKDGKYIKKYGTFGDNEERLHNPSGVAVNDQSHVITLDRGNAHVVVYEPNGHMVLRFGGHGDGNGHFNCPSAVVVNSKGHIIVSDFGNDRIQVFGSGGQFMFKFGKSGSSDGDFNWPTGVATTADDSIVVSDSYNHRIQVFKPDGTFATRFGSEGSLKGQLKRPEGVAVTIEGSIIVADWGNDRIQVF